MINLLLKIIFIKILINSDISTTQFILHVLNFPRRFSAELIFFLFFDTLFFSFSQNGFLQSSNLSLPCLFNNLPYDLIILISLLNHNLLGLLFYSILMILILHSIRWLLKFLLLALGCGFILNCKGGLYICCFILLLNLKIVDILLLLSIYR